MSAQQQARSDRPGRVIVVGGGLAGLAAAVCLCHADVPVDLISPLPARQWFDPEDGLNAALGVRGSGDAMGRHFADTIRTGGWLAHHPPVRSMVEAGPELVPLLERWGVLFARTPEGRIELGRSSGSRDRRTVFTGGSTGQQIVRVLDEQVRRFESCDATNRHGVSLPGERLVRRFERWDLLALVQDDHGVVVGVVAQDLTTMRIRSFVGDAVCLASGGWGAVFGPTVGSSGLTGLAPAIALRAGAVFANPELVQVHPTAILGADKPRLVGDCVRAAGSRLWVPKEPEDRRAPAAIPERERDYFLERLHPDLGNLVSHDVAARSIHHVVHHEQRGVRGGGAGSEAGVYLDVSRCDEPALRRRAGTTLAMARRFSDSEPTILRVAPAVYHTLGGLWVDYECDATGRLREGSPRNQATNVPGLYAVGECEFQYHGASLLGGNAALGALFAGWTAAAGIASYRDALARRPTDLPGSVFESVENREAETYQTLLERDTSDSNDDNPFTVWDELGVAMRRDCLVERHDERLEELLTELATLAERAGQVECRDHGRTLNQSAQWARHLPDLILLAELVVRGALRRQECRGAHYKPALDPARDSDGVGQGQAESGCNTFARVEGGEVRFVRDFGYESAGVRVRVTDAVDVTPHPPAETSTR